MELPRYLWRQIDCRSPSKQIAAGREHENESGHGREEMTANELRKLRNMRRASHFVATHWVGNDSFDFVIIQSQINKLEALRGERGG